MNVLAQCVLPYGVRVYICMRNVDISIGECYTWKVCARAFVHACVDVCVRGNSFGLYFPTSFILCLLPLKS